MDKQRSFFPYSWYIDEKEKSTTNIRVYGLNNKNESVCVKIYDFQPYIYIELPENIDWNKYKVGLVFKKLQMLLKNKGSSIQSHELVYKKKLYYAHLDKDKNVKTFPYLYCKFNSTRDIKNLTYSVKDKLVVSDLGAIKVKIHEQDASPILQLCCTQNIPTAGWIKIYGKEVSEADKETLCTHEYVVKSKNICAIKDRDYVAKPKIMGFDIEVNSSNPSAMPKAEKSGDKVFQISCIFSMEGDDEKDYKKYLLSLGNPDPKTTGEDINIYSYINEAELLEGFTDLILEENPNVIVGYNILGFDIPYMIARAKKEYIISSFDRQGFHKYNHASEKTIKWSSSAYKNQEFQFLDAEGRLFVDLMPLVKRDYKLDNYKLKTVSEYFLKDKKDDLSAKGIFKCYRMGMKGGEKGSKALGMCGKYCIKDSVLVVKLMEKLQIWVGLTEMACVCNVQPFTLYTQGQQVKVFSQIYKYCYENNIVVEKDVYTVSDKERYVGAHVFDPIPGCYDRVVPFDFASLYPTTIIAYNIDYSTLVLDPEIPDSECHVMDWEDHIGCLVKGSNITLNGFNINIEDLVKNNNLVLSHSEKTNRLEYKTQSNWFNQGIKECIELTFEDGSSVKCTPDHRIMTSNNEWIQAQDLYKNNYRVKKSISYPQTIFKDHITDYKLKLGDIEFSMDSIENIEKFSKFARMFGFLYTDGNIAKNRATCYVGDIVDANCMIDDIYYICGEKVIPKYEVCDSTLYRVRIPHAIHNSSLWELGDGYGNRMEKDSELPAFILDKNCPKILKREFLGGLFGGDGLSPSYNMKTKNYTTAGFTSSKNINKQENLVLYFESIQKILKDDFNIGSYLNGPYNRKDKSIHEQVSMNLYIEVNDLIKFYEQIGYRYCSYKMLRLEVLCSYKKYINNIFDQRQKCCKIAQQLKTRMSWDDAIKKSHIIMKHDVVYNNHYSFPNKMAVIDSIRRPKNGNKKTFWSNNIYSFEKYIKELEIEYIYTTNIYGKKQTEIDTIPYYTMKIINVKNIGKQQVFDLEIKDNHSFLADGVVVHNCQHDPKVIRKVELTKYIDSQKEEMSKLRVLRDKSKKNKKYKEEIVAQIEKMTKALKPYQEERSNLQKSKPKFPMCAERHYRFLKEPKGVLPTILQNLLNARKHTRNQMKDITKELKDCKEVNKIKELTLLYNVLDKRQLAYKVSANSAYGALGVRKGYLPLLAGAMCTTYMGRINIELVAKTIPEKYGGELVYGDTDCVLATTPVLIFNDSVIDYKTVEELSDGNWTRINPNKEISQAKKGYKIWSDKGFTEIVNVVRCGIQKPLSRILTHVGEITCSTEHSLLRENLECVSPIDLKIKDKLCISELPLPNDTPKLPLYNNKLTVELIEEYVIPNDYYMDVSAELAFVWGMFYADGSCGAYECGPKKYIKHTWAINNQDNKLLERCINILSENEINMDFKILDTMKSSHVNKLVAKQKSKYLEHQGDIKLFVQKYRELFYDNRKYKKVPTIILNAPLAIRQSFFMGYYAGDGSRKDPAISLSNKGGIGSAGLFFLMKSIGYQVSINTRNDKVEIYKLTGSTPEKKMRAIPNAVKKIIDIKAEEGEYIYDIQTGNHHFAAGVGELVVHNSNYIHFPHLKTAKETWEYSEHVAAEITKMFPPPISLAYEEVIYWRFIIFTKKRYIYNSCDKEGNISKKVGKKGVLLARRDSSLFIRKLYEDVITKVFERESKEHVIGYVLYEINKLCSNAFEYKDFVVTKSVGDTAGLSAVEVTDEKGVTKMKVGDYKVPSLLKDKDERDAQLLKKDAVDIKDFYLKSLPGQVQLAERMRRRGMRVDPGSRLEYVIIESEDNFKDKTSEKMESVDYFANHRDVLKIDFMYYLKLLTNPMDQVLITAYKEKDFTLKQYKFRIQRCKVLEELRNLFRPKLKFIE